MSDLYVSATADGFDVSRNRPNYPEMTGGLDNAVALSVFTAPWWHNRIAPRNERYTSTVPCRRVGMLTARTARDVVSAINKSLQWLTEDGVAQSIETTAEINGRDRLDVRIVVTEPRRGRVEYAYGLNWAAQEIHVLTEARR